MPVMSIPNSNASRKHKMEAHWCEAWVCLSALCKLHVMCSSSISFHAIPSLFVVYAIIKWECYYVHSIAAIKVRANAKPDNNKPKIQVNVSLVYQLSYIWYSYAVFFPLSFMVFRNPFHPNWSVAAFDDVVFYISFLCV